MQDYYFSWGSCSPSLRRSCSLHRGVHSDCKFQLPLVPFYDNRNNVSYPSKLLNSFSKALLGFASFRGIVDGKPPLLVHLDTAMYIVPYCKRLEKWFEGQIHLGYAFTETFA